ncbi:group II intron reverse transcriptase/maturase [Priestia megaterium]|uniref:group II intron reverse transcriptase/maturase n=1 Tax=Priestia megaterium TaxID=1404 RepID=UPI002E250D0E|nr:group II intron reverse transcriptase/maturase [Priestia megaterium]MED4285639.1 group II intron reverse transcriptase/maturase [Priestia megaterium]
MAKKITSLANLLVPRTERELNEYLAMLYTKTKEETNNPNVPWELKGYKSLLEVMKSKPVIIRAIEKLRRNPGSMTPGIDKKTIREFLELNYDELLSFIEQQFNNYNPKQVRRKWIPKPGKKEKRPLGIPAIGDRIIQQCVCIVIEPILEAQFYKHSYGFRPQRNTKQAFARVIDAVSLTGHFWLVEGDIKGFFDNVNHNILLKKLYAMGIRDKRVLMILKSMLKAGILNEIARNELGTPQGGIISPLLANVYLHSFDQWISREYEEKNFKREFSTRQQFNKERRKLKRPAYLVRYADDWILITNSKESAERWKYKITNFLKNRLKLELSQEKTLITNITRKTATFVGYDMKFRKVRKKQAGRGPRKHGYIPMTKPNKDRMKAKVENLGKEIRNLGFQRNSIKRLEQINKINSTIVGLHNYYDICTHINLVMAKHSEGIRIKAYNTIKKMSGPKRKRSNLTLPANEVDNLVAKHENYTSSLPYLTIGGKNIGITRLNLVKTRWRYKDKDGKGINPVLIFGKDQKEDPYTPSGRKRYYHNAEKQPLSIREDALLESDLSWLNHQGTDSKYNVEYIIKRARAFNRDKGQCKCCHRKVGGYGLQLHMHHKNPSLKLAEVNNINNLVTLCEDCHRILHSNHQYEESNPRFTHLNKKGWKKLEDYRAFYKKSIK